VTTFSAGTTGLTPSSATSGAITLGGTLNISNGGTGATTSSGALTTLGASPAAGSSSITTVGTISSGTWQGTRIADSYLSTNVGLLSATNAWSGQNNFGSGTPGYTPPSSPYLATIYSNAANTTSGIGLVTAAYYNTQSNWDAIVQTTSQTIASFSQGTPGGALTTIGSINYNGTGTTYGTTSDRRLKENIAALPAGTGLEKIAALQPRSFTWKQNGAADMGFIADELQAVVPNAVSGSPDAVREDGSIKAQAVDTSFLVVYLVQAIQEMAAEISTLKAKVGI
jgi:hypothetical protein